MLLASFDSEIRPYPDISHYANFGIWTLAWPITTVGP